MFNLKTTVPAPESVSAHAACVITWKERAYIPDQSNSRNVRVYRRVLTGPAVGEIGITLSWNGQALVKQSRGKQKQSKMEVQAMCVKGGGGGRVYDVVWLIVCYEILLQLLWGDICNKNAADGHTKRRVGYLTRCALNHNGLCDAVLKHRICRPEYLWVSGGFHRGPHLLKFRFLW